MSDRSFIDNLLSQQHESPAVNQPGLLCLMEFSSGVYFLGGATIALVIGALVYLKATRTWLRLASMLVGLTSAWGIATAGSALYWNGRAESWMGTPGDASTIVRGGFIAWGLFLGLMLAPGLLSMLPGFRSAEPPLN